MRVAMNGDGDLRTDSFNGNRAVRLVNSTVTSDNEDRDAVVSSAATSSSGNRDVRVIRSSASTSSGDRFAYVASSPVANASTVRMASAPAVVVAASCGDRWARASLASGSCGDLQVRVASTPSARRAVSGAASLGVFPTATRGDVEASLNFGKRAQQSIRCKVSGSLVLCGLALGVLAQLPASLYEDSLLRWLHEDCSGRGTYWAVQVSGMVVLSMAPMRGDLWLTRAVLLAHMAVMAISVVIEVGWTVSEPKALRHRHFAFAAVESMFLVMCACAIAVRDSWIMQRIMWHSLQFLFGGELLIDLTLHALRLSGYSRFEPTCHWTVYPGDLIGLLFSVWPGFRDWVHQLLGAIFDRRRAKAAAASIAGLLGDCSVPEVVAQARTRFRCVRLSQIPRERLASPDPDTALSALAVQVPLGACDAFVSHSWSDNGENKWAVLQEWCEAFAAEHGREPTLWLDKACVNQADIEADLKCLPVFLSGCKEMVVLCGTSYCSRLWCILELFTYQHMARSDGLTVLPVFSNDAQGRAYTEQEEIRQTVQAFDVSRCRCSSPRDQERIMQVLLAAFGSRAAFNEVCRAALVEAGLSGWQDAEFLWALDDSSGDGRSSSPSDSSDSD